MKHQWRMRRQFHQHPDGQRRWDRAYQLLLQWTTPPPTPEADSTEVDSTEADSTMGPVLPPQLTEPTPLEVSHAPSHLCSRLHPPTGTDPEH